MLRARRKGGVYVLRRDGQDEPLTVDPALQDQLTAIMRSYQTPYAAVVAMDPRTGRVLALAEHSEQVPGLRGLTTKAIYPAASIFKIVTGVALLEAGVGPDVTECYHGGKRRLSAKLLKDSARDRHCVSLATAMGASANVVFAKLASKHLSAERLRGAAETLGFNRPLSFAVPAETSMAAIPEDAFGLASTAAGFGDVYLSPLHGAMIASAAANGGTWPRAVLFEKDAALPHAPVRVFSEKVAAALTEMLEETVTTGTARRIFRERGFRVRGAVGKTGTLADRNPFRDYSWFVGFAPKDDPKVAVAAVVVNDPLWRIRATWLGREAMRLYLEGQDKALLASGGTEDSPAKDAQTAPATPEAAAPVQAGPVLPAADAPPAAPSAVPTPAGAASP
jgi:cell division protein FtsI/penicillin-binding protein 2